MAGVELPGIGQVEELLRLGGGKLVPIGDLAEERQDVSFGVRRRQRAAPDLLLSGRGLEARDLGIARLGCCAVAHLGRVSESSRCSRTDGPALRRERRH